MTEIAEDDDRLLTIREVAVKLGVSVWTVQRMIRQGLLAFVDVGIATDTRARIPESEVRAFLTERRTQRRA